MEPQLSKLSLDCVKEFKVILPDDAAKVEAVIDKIMTFGALINQAIIYVNTPETANMLMNQLREAEFHTVTVNDSLPKEERDEQIELFNKEFTQILVTLDRLDGIIDQSRVNLVVKYDLPVIYGSLECEEESNPDIAVYLKRSCSKGAAFNFLCGNIDKMIMGKIERHLNYWVTELPTCTSRDFVNAFKESGLY